MGEHDPQLVEAWLDAMEDRRDTAHLNRNPEDYR